MKVPFFSRVAVGVVWAAGVVALSFLTADTLTLAVAAAAGVWFQFYLAGQRIEIAGDKIVRHSGRLFTRRTIIIVSNISWVQTAVFRESLPGIMKIIYPGGNLYIIGFTGRQLALIERAILKETK
ncbi:MAG: hypothetical protein IJ410_00965 [Oscillospiraceae bacterium]|nr:hypothetical protein [Oscillospiraceae bacterium]